jgi:4-amino-4-deoxy-L-arabinose transferase-like glycosyltransferase
MNPSAPLLVVTWLLVLAVMAGPLLALHLWLQRKTWADERWQVVLPLVALGLFAYAACIAFYFSPAFGRVAVTAPVLAAWAWVVRRLIRDRALGAEHGLILPLGCAAALGLCYLALLYLPQLGQSYVMQSAARFVHQLPPDPDLPETLGHRLYLGEPLRPFAGDWLSSDRPPLQAGFYLLALPWINLTGVPAGLGYECVGVLAQLLWVPAVWLLGRSLGQSRLTAGLTAVIVGTVGIVMLNTVYVWPKFLGAAYVVCAGILLLDAARPRTTPLLILAALAGGLGALAHGSVAFSLAGLVPLWLLQRCPYWRKVPLLLATFAAVMLPWILYQRFIDPPGDRLLKWHLAGVIPIDGRSFPEALLDAYRHQSWDQWLAARRANLRFLFFGSFRAIFDVFTTAAKTRRQEEFFYLWRAIGVLNLAWVIAPALAWYRRSWTSDARLAVALAGWTISTVILWLVVMFVPSSTMLHQGSYVVLLVAAGLAAVLLLHTPRRLGWFVLAWHFCYFAITWLRYDGSRPLNSGLFFVGGIGLVALAAALAAAARLDRRIAVATDTTSGLAGDRR